MTAPTARRRERATNRAQQRNQLDGHNSYSRGLWLAVGFYNPGCSDGGNWGKKGWWRLGPGQAATVLATTNTYSTFYAEADDGRIWADPYTTNVPLQAFDWCWNTGSASGDIVGMRL